MVITCEVLADTRAWRERTPQPRAGAVMGVGTGAGFAASQWACGLARVGSKFRYCGAPPAGRTLRRPRWGPGRLRGPGGAESSGPRRRSRPLFAAARRRARCAPASSPGALRSPRPALRAAPPRSHAEQPEAAWPCALWNPGTGAASLPVAAGCSRIGGGGGS